MRYKLCFLTILLLSSSLIAMEGYFPPFGKDADISYFHEAPKEKEIANTYLYKIAKSLIAFHQKVISPADGPRSHFNPVSSRYMLLAIQKHGLFIGYLKGCDRLMRENNATWVYDTIIIDERKVKYDKP